MASLRDSLIFEQVRFRRDASIARLDALNAYSFWMQTGRTKEEYLAKFFTAHHRSLELDDRIEWIDLILAASDD